MEGSGSGHCCFEVTVVDTMSPVPDRQFVTLREVAEGKDGSNPPTTSEETICECFSKENAERVCSALNDQEDRRSK